MDGGVGGASRSSNRENPRVLILVGVAVSAFVVTNVDAFIVMTALFATSSRNVAGIMIGNGGDNVLAPLFRVLGLAHSIFVSAVLLVLDGATCAMALRAGQSRLIIRAVERMGEFLVPAVYSAIGIALLLRAGTPSSFAGHP